MHTFSCRGKLIVFLVFFVLVSYEIRADKFHDEIKILQDYSREHKVAIGQPLSQVSKTLTYKSFPSKFLFMNLHESSIRQFRFLQDRDFYIYGPILDPRFSCQEQEHSFWGSECTPTFQSELWYILCEPDEGDRIKEVYYLRFQYLGNSILAAEWGGAYTQRFEGLPVSASLEEIAATIGLPLLSSDYVIDPETRCRQIIYRYYFTDRIVNLRLDAATGRFMSFDFLDIERGGQK